jgi:ABC-2 type transport system permease protein
MRHALYGELAWLSLGVVIVSTIVFYMIAAAGYDPQRGLVRNARGG